MPVQAKASLAAMLLDDLVPSTQSGKIASKDDKDSSDFGVALSSLVSVPFVAPPAKASATATSSSAGSAPIAGDSSNQHTATATPSPMFGGGNDAETVLAAWFNYPSESGSASASAAENTGTSVSSGTTSAESVAKQAVRSPTPAAGAGVAAGAGTVLSSAVGFDATAWKTATAQQEPAAPAAPVSIKIVSSPATARSAQNPQTENAAGPDIYSTLTPVAAAMTESATASTPASDSTAPSGKPATVNTTASKSTSAASTPDSQSQTNPNAVASNAPSSAATPATQDVPMQPLTTRAASAYEAQAASEKPAERERSLLGREDSISADSAPSAQIQLSNDGAAPKVTEAAQIRQVLDAVSNAPATRVANLKVDLSEGQSAQAIVRERAGNVEVKIVAPGAESARRISGEFDGLRSTLEGAGLHLAQAEVSYQPGSGHGSRRDSGGEKSRNPSNQQSNSKEIFNLDEVNQ
jgi:hypothetical protein